MVKGFLRKSEKNHELYEVLIQEYETNFLHLQITVPTVHPVTTLVMYINIEAYKIWRNNNKSQKGVYLLFNS